MSWLLLAALALCQISGSSTDSASPFLKDPVPNFKLSEVPSHVFQTVVPSLVTEASNASYLLIGSAGGVFGSALDENSGSLNLHHYKFPALLCPSGMDSSCYQATRIIQKSGRWFVCANRENQLDIERYEFVDQQGLKGLSSYNGDASSPFFCPYHGPAYMAVDLPSPDSIQRPSSIIFTEIKKQYQIDKIDLRSNQDMVKSTIVQEKLIRTIGEFEYKNEVWFLYVVAGSNQEGPVAKIARVCANDNGYKSTGFFAVTLWTSLAYLRLQCVIKGFPDFIFNEMKDAQFHLKTKTLYATFTTAENSIPGSAVCKFDIDEIHRRLQGSREARIFVPINGTRPDEKEMYSCSAQNKNYPNDVLLFLTENKYVKEPYRVEPIITIMREDYRLDKIGVELIDVAPVYNTRPSVMMYIANNQGDLLKVRHNMSEGITEWTEIQKFTTSSRFEELPVSKILLEAENSVIITMKSGNVIQVPKSSCSLMTSCRSCLGLGDPRCMWNSKASDSSDDTSSAFTSSCIHSTKYLTKDFWGTFKGNTVDQCPDEDTTVLPVVGPSDKQSTVTDPTDKTGTLDPNAQCSGADCNQWNSSDSSIIAGETAAAQKEPASGFKGGLIGEKWVFAVAVAAPTFLVGLIFGMTTLFMYAYCKARRGSQAGHDTNRTSVNNMDDPEYGQDTNFYEPPPICAADHRISNPNMAAQIKTSMAPQYFSSNVRGGYAKDYDIIESLSRQNSHNMMTNSPVMNQHVLMNGMNGVPPQQLGLMHHNASNGYLVGPVNGNGVTKPAPKVPPRPRNMSSYSTSSEGMDPTMDMAITSRTPHDENRLVYQVPRGNNRFSNHEYEPGDIHFSAIPESETTPMLNPYSNNETEQHSSLRRGQTMPRNGRFTDQHVEHAMETNHSSLPRKITNFEPYVQPRCSTNSSSVSGGGGMSPGYFPQNSNYNRSSSYSASIPYHPPNSPSRHSAHSDQPVYMS